MAKNKQGSRRVSETIEDMARSLEGVIVLLNKHGVVSDVSDLYQIQTRLLSDRFQHGKYKYNGRVLFDVPVPKKVRPRGIRDVQVELGVKIAGTIREGGDDMAYDPLQVMEVQLLLTGLSSTQDRKHFCAWHIDRHVDSEGSEQQSELHGGSRGSSIAGVPVDLHPRYHIQFGGRELRRSLEDGIAGEDEDYGGLLFGEAPRIAVPPIDIVLAIDFVLANFHGRAWQMLRRESAYLDSVRAAQVLLWRPYVRALLGAWDLPVQTGWSHLELWPSIL